MNTAAEHLTREVTEAVRAEGPKRARPNWSIVTELEAYLEDRERSIAGYRKWQLPLLLFGAFIGGIASAAVRAVFA